MKWIIIILILLFLLDYNDDFKELRAEIDSQKALIEELRSKQENTDSVLIRLYRNQAK